MERERGFTLVELLTVVAIMAVLMSLLIYGLNTYRKMAYVEGTRALLLKLTSSIDAYHSEYRRYPPDGFDKPTFRLDGGRRVQIRGTQCLIYYLGFPTVKITEVGEEKRKRELIPFLEVTGGMLSGDGDLDEKLANPMVELIDTYKHPIHYDNVERDRDRNPRVSDQNSAGDHSSPDFVADLMHGPDPRGEAGGTVGPKNPGAYDLWSHGQDVTDPGDDITNWE
ncbi:type II secretion system protein [Planctomycetota bacterium]